MTNTLALSILAGLALPVFAQPAENTPAPQQPAAIPHEPSPISLVKTNPLGRRPSATNDTVLAFPEATVKQIIPFIMESTGKVVIPQQTVQSIRISIVNDKPIPREQALDFVFFALQQAGVAVIEHEDYILLRDQADIERQPVPVLGPEVSTLDRTDLGSIVQKIFTLKHASAANVADIIRASLPEKTSIIADNDSAQVVVTAPIAMLQRTEKVINALDRPPADLPKSETFNLRYADADLVATSIRELFADTTTRRNNGNNQNNNQGGNRPNQGGGNNPGGRAAIMSGIAAIAGGEAGSGARAAATPTSSILRVISNPTQNAVSVVAESNILDLIRTMIQNEWDKPIPEFVLTPRVYDLKYTDPVKIKAVLEGTFGTGAAGGGNRSTNQKLAGQFTFQAIPEAHRLVVVTKTPDNMAVIDKIIDELDQPLVAGMPELIELKHVQAEDLAEQLNALLAQEGTFAQIRRVNTELTTGGSNGASPFSTEFTQNENGFSQTQSNADNMRFWWQNARVPTDNSGNSNLIAKARIVPIAKRNSVLVLAPVEYKKSIAEMITLLDKPGRQVLIAAVIAEISAEAARELGLRFSNTAISTTKQDGAISIGPNPANASTLTGTKPNILNNIFDTSTLSLGLNVNAVLQALDEKTKVTVLSEPRIFTGDNVEANFFDGQDVPFITQNQPATGTTSLVQNFDYRAVGINLKVRPRITPERKIDIKVNLELSSIEPNQTLFGGFIVDRRQTTTQVIVNDGQTVVISGIMRSTDSDIRRKIPFFGDIPGPLGDIFSSNDRIKTNTELIAFITPIVVNNDADSNAINDPARERLGELRDELGTKPPPSTKPAQSPAPPASSPSTNPYPD